MAVSPPGLLLNMEDCALPKSFTPSPTLSFLDGGGGLGGRGSADAPPWYRFHRPTAPIPSVEQSDSLETSSPSVVTTNPTTPATHQSGGAGGGVEDLTTTSTLDQENLSPPQPPSISPTSSVFPLAAVSNILQSPVIFGG